MGRKRFSAEQIILKLREAEVLLGKVQSMLELVERLPETEIQIFSCVEEGASE